MIESVQFLAANLSNYHVGWMNGGGESSQIVLSRNNRTGRGSIHKVHNAFLLLIQPLSQFTQRFERQRIVFVFPWRGFGDCLR